MKNILKYLSIGSLVLTAMNLQASELGEINNYSEVIHPIEKDGNFNITVSGVTNDQGLLYLPSYEDSSVSSYSIISGKLEQGPKYSNERNAG